MNYTSIEKQIIEKSDRAASEEIQKITDPIRRLITVNLWDKIDFKIKWHGEEHEVKIPHKGMITKIIEKILADEIFQKRRDEALSNFLGKFNAVVNQIEELGIDLEGIQQERGSENE